MPKGAEGKRIKIEPLLTVTASTMRLPLETLHVDYYVETIPEDPLFKIGNASSGLFPPDLTSSFNPPNEALYTF
jgi:hypothetical protein